MYIVRKLSIATMALAALFLSVSPSARTPAQTSSQESASGTGSLNMCIAPAQAGTVRQACAAGTTCKSAADCPTTQCNGDQVQCTNGSCSHRVDS